MSRKEMASPFPITLYCNFNCLCHEQHHSFDTAEILPTSSWNARNMALLPLHMGLCCYKPPLREAKVVRMEDPYVDESS